LAERKVSDEFEFSVATMPPTLRHRQLALAVVAILLTLRLHLLAPPVTDTAEVVALR